MAETIPSVSDASVARPFTLGPLLQANAGANIETPLETPLLSTPSVIVNLGTRVQPNITYNAAGVFETPGGATPIAGEAANAPTTARPPLALIGTTTAASTAGTTPAAAPAPTLPELPVQAAATATTAATAIPTAAAVPLIASPAPTVAATPAAATIAAVPAEVDSALAAPVQTVAATPVVAAPVTAAPNLIPAAEPAPLLATLTAAPVVTAINAALSPAGKSAAAAPIAEASDRSTSAAAAPANEATEAAEAATTAPAAVAIPTTATAVAPPEFAAPPAAVTETEIAATFTLAPDPALFARSNVEQNPSYAGIAASLYVNAMIHRARQGAVPPLETPVFQPIADTSPAVSVNLDRNGPADDQRNNAQFRRR